MRVRGVFPGGAFLLVLLVTVLFLLSRELGPLRAGAPQTEPGQWVHLTDPDYGARFYSFTPGESVGQLAERALPGLSGQLADRCKRIALEPGTRVRLCRETASKERDCLVSQLPERCRYLLGMPLNVNRAGEADLVMIPGIGPKLAKGIVAYRQSKGCFSSPDDFLRVPGIGRKLLENMRRHLCFGTAGGCPCPKRAFPPDEA
jgi:competence ComEA-like helix-hairpin-helix protein